MLRITVEEEDGTTSFHLEGKLKGDWVRELERCWLYERNSRQPGACCVDLDNVNFVDETGMELLQRMVFQGARLQARNLMMASLAEHVLSRCKAGSTAEPEMR